MTDYYNLMLKIAEVYEEWNCLGHINEEEAFNKIKKIIKKSEYKCNQNIN